MKTVTFTVGITFADKIYSDEEIKEIAENVKNAILSHANTAGIAPENSETFTENISIAKDGIELVNEKIY